MRTPHTNWKALGPMIWALQPKTLDNHSVTNWIVKGSIKMRGHLRDSWSLAQTFSWNGTKIQNAASKLQRKLRQWVAMGHCSTWLQQIIEPSQDDEAAITFLCADIVSRVIHGVRVPPHIELCMLAKHIIFGPISPEILLSTSLLDSSQSVGYKWLATTILVAGFYHTTTGTSCCFLPTTAFFLYTKFVNFFE